MASLSFGVGLGYARSSLDCSEFQRSCRTSSAHFGQLSSNVLYSRITLWASRRNAAATCLSNSAEILTSTQPQTKLDCFPLLSPAIRGSLLAVSAESIADSKRLILSKLLSCFKSEQWQGLQRYAFQLSAVLVLANAFYSDISPPNPYDTLENIPQDISGGEARKRIQRPKSPKAERCTQKCVGTCVRGGAGSPGEGPFNIRKPLVVFKEGFRTRQYCLIECSDICNLLGDGDDGP